MSPLSLAMSMAGASSDQKEAAIITPAAKPSIASSTRRSTVLKRKTIAAPSAVTPQVKQVAIRASQTGLTVVSHAGSAMHIAYSGRRRHRKSANPYYNVRMRLKS